MLSRRTVLRAAGTAAVVASPGCAAPMAASSGGGTDSDHGAVDDHTLIAVADGEDEREALAREHVASVGEVRRHRQGDGFVLPATLTDAGVASLTETLRAAGALADPDGVELRFYFEGELKRTFGLGPGLAAAIDEGEFDGEFLLVVESREEAGRVRAELRG